MKCDVRLFLRVLKLLLHSPFDRKYIAAGGGDLLLFLNFVLRSQKNIWASGKGDPILDTAILPDVLALDICIKWQECCKDRGPCSLIDGKWPLWMCSLISDRFYSFARLLWPTYLVIVHVCLDVARVNMVYHITAVRCLQVGWKVSFKFFARSV